MDPSSPRQRPALPGTGARPEQGKQLPQPWKNKEEMKMSQAQTILRKADSVMEKGVLDTIKDFISNGGTPEEVIKCLSESYRGFSEMAQLLAWWMNEIGFTKEEVVDLVERYLKSMVVDNFNPKKADSIFHSHLASEPEWLVQMLQTFEWRTVIYRLSEQHENCLMLNYAVQRIARNGQWKEIVEHGGQGTVNAACTSFTVFNQILLESIDSVMSADSFEEFMLQPLIDTFARRSDFSEHTYLYVQLFLKNLVQRTNAHNLKRLIQELSNSAEKHDPEFVGRVKNYLGKSDPFRFAGISSDLSKMQSHDHVQSSHALAQIYRSYSSPNPPPLELLQELPVLNFLVDSLFCKNARRSFSRETEDRIVFLLALACASPPLSADNCPLTSPSSSSSSSSSSSFSSADTKTRVSQTQAALHKILRLLSSSMTPSSLQQGFPDICSLICDYPIIGIGAIKWAEKTLSSQSFYGTSHFSQLTPMVLYILQVVAEVHVLLRDMALRVLVSTFELKTELDPMAALQINRQVLDTMVSFAALGHALPVLQVVERWTTTIDQAYIRHFLSQLEEIASPPFSPAFARAMLKLLRQPAAVASLNSVASTKSRFVEFIKTCDTSSLDSEDPLLAEVKAAYGLV